MSRMRKVTTLSLALVCLTAGVLTGCDRPEPPPGPKAVLRELIAARAAHDHQRIIAHTHPERARTLVSTLLALDEFLVANNRLCDALRAAGLTGVAQSVDQSHLAHRLGVFSPRVELLDEHITGDTAEVAFTVDGRLPARRAQLVRRDGRWCYDPGPAPPRLPDAFREMARGLREARATFERGDITVAEIKRDPAIMLSEVISWLRPGVELLAPLPQDKSDPSPYNATDPNGGGAE